MLYVQAAAAAERIRNESHRILYDTQVGIYILLLLCTLHIISENYRPPPFSKTQRSRFIMRVGGHIIHVRVNHLYVYYERLCIIYVYIIICYIWQNNILESERNMLYIYGFK